MSLITGVRCFFTGLGLTYRAPLRRYIWAPIFASLLVVGLGLTFTYSYISDLSTYLVASLPSWLSLLEWILAPLLYLLGTLVGVWTFTFFAVILGAPWHGKLSKLAEPKSRSTNYEELGLGKTIIATFGRELRKLRYHIPRLLLAVVVSVIPVVNTIAPVVWLVVGAWMMSAQFCDYPNENRGIAFSTTLDQLGRARGAALGFGLCTTFAMSIPLLNFLVVPAAVIGGARLWSEIQQEESQETLKSK